MKITKRDVRFFILGVLTLFLIESIMDWEGTKESFKNGFSSGYDAGSATQVDSEE